MFRNPWHIQVSLLVLAALAVLGFSVQGTPATAIPLILFLGVLSAIAEAFDVVLPQGVTASVSFAIIFAGLLLFGPWPAVFVALFVTWTPGDMARGVGPSKVLATGSIAVICTAAAGLVFVKLFGGTLLPHGIMLAQIPRLGLAVGASSVVFFILNTGILAVDMALLTGASITSFWLQTFKWGAPNYLALAALGVVIAQILVSVGMVGVVLVVVPLFVARQTFQVYVKLRAAYQETVHSLVAAIEAKDAYTRGHSERVADHAETIGRELRMSEEQIDKLKIAALLHDLGKIGIQRSILSKTGRLSEEEFALMQEHPELATEILRDVDFLEDVIPTIYHHHEHYDGSGYMKNLRGEQIPLTARILSVADAYDAMISARPYRKALSPEAAAAELVSCSGSQFDRRIVEALLAVTGVRPQPAGEIDLSEGQLRIVEDTAQ